DDRIDKYSLDKIRLDKNRLDKISEPKGSMSVETDAETIKNKSHKEIVRERLISEGYQIDNEGFAIPKSTSEKIDFERIMDYWNQRSGLKEIQAMTQKRKDFINVRVKNHGIDAIYQAIDNCMLSSFMKGDNNKNWIANFDWVFGNPSNFIKVLEGNYINEDYNPGKQDELHRRAENLKRKFGESS
ncbi:MAG: hypothetical protein RG740_05650, partial [Acholeplasmataceae bacterium]|nr:hypothetical protein [Acholeplasmataceae bacterium]